MDVENDTSYYKGQCVTFKTGKSNKVGQDRAYARFRHMINYAPTHIKKDRRICFKCRFTTKGLICPHCNSVCIPMDRGYNRACPPKKTACKKKWKAFALKFELPLMWQGKHLLGNKFLYKLEYEWWKLEGNCKLVKHKGDDVWLNTVINRAARRRIKL